MSYSWYNIDDAYDNNKIQWRKKTESWKTLVFPNGMYDYTDINSFLQAQTGKVNPKDKDSDFIFTLYFDMRIYRVVILMHGDYELDLTQGRFENCSATKKRFLTGVENHVGDTVANVMRRRLGVSPLRSDHAAGKQCPERRLVQFFNNRVACRLPVYKNAETAPMAPCEQKQDLFHKDQGDRWQKRPPGSQRD